ncbi:MAG: hypothetical protein IH885_04475 [Myxococcales bacterium]|nr:hypothetical protein [Myxococcales bacterium]
MPWLKLCDRWRDHTKIRKAGLWAAGLHAALMSYSGDKLSDGVFHPDDLEDVWPWDFEQELELVLELLGPVFERALDDKAQEALSRELESFRLPSRVVLDKLLSRLQVRHRGERGPLVEKHGRRGALRLYNYDKYNPSRAQYEAQKAAAAERQRRKRDRQKAESQLAAELCTHIVHAQVDGTVKETTLSRRESRGTTHVTHPVTSSGVSEELARTTPEIRSAAPSSAETSLPVPRPVPCVTLGTEETEEQQSSSTPLEKKEALGRGGLGAEAIHAFSSLQGHDVLASVATPEMATACAMWQWQYHKSRQELDGAIADVARDALARAAVNQPLSRAQVSDRLGRYIGHGRGPKQRDKAAASEAEHYARQRAQGAQYAAQRRRSSEEGAYLERSRQQGELEQLKRLAAMTPEQRGMAASFKTELGEKKTASR